MKDKPRNPMGVNQNQKVEEREILLKRIKKAIDTEDKLQPLTDDELFVLTGAKELGFKRNNVRWGRWNILGIPGSSRRKVRKIKNSFTPSTLYETVKPYEKAIFSEAHKAYKVMPGYDFHDVVQEIYIFMMKYAYDWDPKEVPPLKWVRAKSKTARLSLLDRVHTKKNKIMDKAIDVDFVNTSTGESYENPELVAYSYPSPEEELISVENVQSRFTSVSPREATALHKIVRSANGR